MSGPKVIRIVTREELVAICERVLARIDAAIAHWTKVGTRNGVIDVADISGMKARRAEYANMLRRDRFESLQKSGPAFAEWLLKDMDERLEAKVSIEAKAVETRRRAIQAARMMLEKLRDRGKDVPIDVRHTLERAAAGNVDAGPAVEAAVLHAVALIARKDERSLTETQKGIAERLGADEERLTLQEWLDRQGGEDKYREQLNRIDRHIAKLARIGGGVETKGFLERLKKVDAEADEARKRLLIDSLLVELAAATHAALDAQLRRAELVFLCAELASTKTFEHASLLAEASACPSDAPAPVLDELTAKVRGALDALLAAKVAGARRDAVLNGLAKLGYEVREGMATAWAKDGRVVLRKPATPGYGIEVGGRTEAGRLQMRAVAFGDVARDPSRDADVENLWCGDIAGLNKALGERGGAVVVERALAAGQSPIKVIAASDNPYDHVADIAPGATHRSLK